MGGLIRETEIISYGDEFAHDHFMLELVFDW
jgi:hypothetical protein